MSIRFVNTSTLRLTSFTGYAIQKQQYAILSHTWDNDEISFQEMIAISKDPSHPSTKKEGYKKILDAAERAKSSSIDYLWVDTCCIDKTSSAELNEALNSMYRWYQNATVCYVYLSDLRSPSIDLATGLPHCRWFTRGWCLQELIAPREMEFFDAQWKSLGSKTSLAALISGITKINKEVLLDSNIISSIPVARRMSWAADRETAREEDLAYCLLGIFDISMPMLYGEGSKAFLRLQEQIIINNNDLSIFAFEHATTPEDFGHYRNLFATSPRDFRRCGDFNTARYDAYSNTAFTLTNKGLYFRRLELHINAINTPYSMRLNCESPGFDCSRMYLQKVGASLYARCSSNKPTDSKDYGSRIEEEAYIVNQVMPSVKRQIERSDEFAIQVQSSTHDLFRALQVLERSASSFCWDSARMQFLTQGDRAFRGYWKLFPSLARRFGADEDDQRNPPGHVYLACGLAAAEDSAKPRAWVRLYSVEEWSLLVTKFGIITGLDNLTGCIDRTSDWAALGTTLTDRITITASIQLLEHKEGVPFFRLVVDLSEAPEAWPGTATGRI